MKKIYSKIFMIALISVGAISCGDEKEYFPDLDYAPQDQTHVKILHASFDGMDYLTNPAVPTSKAIRSVNFYLGTTKANGTVIPFGASFPPTGYAIIGSTPDISAIAPFAAALSPTPELPEKVVLNTASLSLDNSKKYTIAITGPNDSREAIVYEDNVDAIPLDGQAYIRFINLTPNGANNFNVFITPPNPAEGPPSTPTKIIENVAYKGVSGDFIPLPAGTYTNLQVRDAVTDAAIATIATQALVGNKVYTYYVRGVIGAAASDPARPVSALIVNR